MTTVIYKGCTIELRKMGKWTDYSIWDTDGCLVAVDSVELPLATVKKDCESLVDEYIDDPRAFG